MALTVSITQLEDTLLKVFADHSPDIRIALGEITMTVATKDYAEIAQTLRLHQVAGRCTTQRGLGYD